MKRLFIFLLLSIPVSAFSQDISMTSHKQAAATAQNVTGTGAQTAIVTTGYSQVRVYLRGTYNGLAFTFQTSPDSTNFFPEDAFRKGDTAPGGIESSVSSLTNVTRSWLVNITGSTRFRLNVTAISSGTANFSITPVASPLTSAVVSNWVNPIRSSVDIIALGDASDNRVALASTTPGGSDLALVVRNIPSGTQTVDSELAAAAALADNTANPTIPGVGAFNLLWDGSTWDRAPGNSASGMLVDLGANNDVVVTTFPDNEPINISQMNGVTVLMNNGAAGTGAQRIVNASDNSAIANWGHGAFGSALPANGTAIGVRDNTGMVAPIQCNQSAVISTSSSGSTQIVALQSSQTIYVCSFDVVAAGTTNLTWNYGTGTACGTGTTALTGAYPLTAQAGIAPGAGLGTIFRTAASNALCINNSAAIGVFGRVTYAQY